MAADTNFTAFHTSQREKWFNKYKASMEDVKDFRGGNCINEYLANRIDSVDKFEGLKLGNTPLSTVFTTPGGQAAKDAINKALTIPEDTPAVEARPAAEGRPAVEAKDAVDSPTDRACKDFNASIAYMKKIIKAEPDTFHFDTVASQLLDLKVEITDKIKEQHKIEKTELLAVFNNANFQRNLGGTPAQINQLKNQMIANLEKSQQAELSKVDKALTESAQKQLEYAEKAYYRLSYLGDRFARSKEMRKEMMKHGPDLPEDLPNPNAAGYIMDAPTGNIRFKGVKVNDLKIHETIDGNTIHVAEDGTCTIRLPRLFLTERRTYADLTSVAEKIKASGADTITTKITCQDPKKAEELGRKAYISAVRAGFPPDKITIYVNGEVKLQHSKEGGKDELFKQRPERLQEADRLAKEIATNVKAKLAKPVELADFKTKIRDFKAAGAPLFDEEAEANAHNAPGGHL